MNVPPNIGRLFVFPYARIVPMHLSIIFGNLLEVQSTGEVVMFLGIKTLADVIMHMKERGGGTMQIDISC